METDEGNNKNKRAGRRSVWWRFQALSNNAILTTTLIGQRTSNCIIDNKENSVAWKNS